MSKMLHKIVAQALTTDELKSKHSLSYLWKGQNAEFTPACIMLQNTSDYHDTHIYVTAR